MGGGIAVKNAKKKDRSGGHRVKACWAKSNGNNPDRACG